MALPRWDEAAVFGITRESRREDGGQRSREEKMEGREAEKRGWRKMSKEQSSTEPRCDAEKQVFEKVKKENTPLGDEATG